MYAPLSLEELKRAVGSCVDGFQGSANSANSMKAGPDTLGSSFDYASQETRRIAACGTTNAGKVPYEDFLCTVAYER